MADTGSMRADAYASTDVQVAVEPQGPVPLPLPQLPAGTAWLLLAAQAVALLGCLVTGTLARKRRMKVDALNSRLRQINTELRRRTSLEELVCAADSEVEAVIAYRNALENALGQPAAAHPVEGYGASNLSLAQARRALSGLLHEGKQALRAKDVSAALLAAEQAEMIAQELADKRAERAVLRLLARVQRERGDLRASLAALERCLAVSANFADESPVDVLGAIADAHADLGDLERAGEYYDKCIAAIQEESPDGLASTWDC
ncbi:hypothetical protein WJX81_000803 [Elliptochloris bilobata]|uniref:Tetratricopeptide repeat protein n=1 Tax=Elliptochloris bilobata TaxID=381761 RepID=A0AAW1S8R2_9CHLO